MLVDQPALRGLEEPAARLLRHIAPRPVHRGGEERLLDRVFGGGEVAVATHERAEDLRRELAQQALDTGRHVQCVPPAVWTYSTIPAASDGASSITCLTWIGCC